jgi:competence protein ComEA
MGSRRPSPEHQEAVSRRLAQLSAELDGVRGRRLDDPTVSRRPAQADDFAMPLTHTRVSRARQSPGPAPEPVPDPAPDPVPAPLVAPPGRHASRRPGRSIADTLPPTLRGRVALGPGQLAFVAGLVAVGLAVTCWWVIRGDPQEVAAPAVNSPAVGLATPAVPVASASSSTEVGEPDGRVTVDVAGKVRRPGIAVLDTGARVIDAIKAAGGARPGVDLTSLNLARLLVDGEQIIVGVAAPTGVAGAAAPIPPGATTGPLVNLNTADQMLLETLPDVGPVTAEAIIAWRTEHGGFTAVDELLEVDGIGDATLATLTPHVTV